MWSGSVWGLYRRAGAVKGRKLPEGVIKVNKNGSKVYEVEKLVDDMAGALLKGSGRGLRNSANLGYVSRDDREVLQRVAGMSVEAFNERLTGKLESLADRIADRMFNEVDKMPHQSLGFNLAVAIDKWQRLKGVTASTSGNVNIQVNNFGALSKEELIARLSGKQPVLAVKTAEEPPLEAEMVPASGPVSEAEARKAVEREVGAA